MRTTHWLWILVIGTTLVLAAWLWPRPPTRTLSTGLAVSGKVSTLRNRAILNTREPAARQAYYDDLRRTVADADAHKIYVMRTSMIQSLRDVATID